MKTKFDENSKSYLTFKLGDELFAAPVIKVSSILEMQRITKVPNSPPYMKGVINLRGNALPAIDLRVKFSFPEVNFTSLTCIIVLEILTKDNVKLQLGAIVDGVHEVIEVDENHIKQPPILGKDYKTEFITGLIEKDDYFIILLDVDSIFSTLEIIELTEAGNNSDIEIEEESSNLKE